MVRQAHQELKFKRRRFTAEFNEEAARLVVKSGRPLAQGARPATSGLICHSDRGSQYGSLKGPTPVGGCPGHDGALSIACEHEPQGQRLGQCAGESFFASLKTELVADP